MPDARVVAPYLLLGAALFGFFLFIGMIFASIEPAVVVSDCEWTSGDEVGEHTRERAEAVTIQLNRR